LNLMLQTIEDLPSAVPETILNRLHIRLQDFFRKNEVKMNLEDDLADTIEMGLCYYVPELSHIQVCLSYFTVYHLRKNQLTEYKGKRVAIGAKIPPKEEEDPDDENLFETQIIEIQPNDRIFLFTDGITDQFGGDERAQKIGARRIKDFLIETGDIPMDEMKMSVGLLISSWKSEHDQTDDMAFLGIEF